MTTQSIADAFYMSKYHLCHIFKEGTGFSPDGLCHQLPDFKSQVIASETGCESRRLEKM